MIRVCPVAVRAWWRVKSAVWPWMDQSKAPESKPRMRQAEDMLATVALDLSQLLDERRRQ